MKETQGPAGRWGQVGVAVVVVLMAVACGKNTSPTSPDSFNTTIAFEGDSDGFASTQSFPSGTKWGERVGDLDGIVIYSNGPGAPSPLPGWSTDYGEPWQCVEFARRYTQKTYGYRLPSVSFAIDFWPKALSGMRRVDNGSLELPQKGDLVIMSGGDQNYGHIAVVRASVSTSSVRIAQQNTLTADYPLAVTVKTVGGTSRYTLSSLTNHSTRGWFTRKSPPILLPVVKSVTPANPRMSTSPQTVTLVTSGIMEDVRLYLTNPGGSQIVFATSNLSLTSTGLTFRPTLGQMGTWSVAVESGGLRSSKYNVTVLR